MKSKIIKTDVLIIGGGTAGCFAAMTLAKNDPQLNILIVEKANIKRSGCLAAGVNAINAYITKGKKPEDYADYATRDADGIVRDDLLVSLSKRLNHVTAELEKLGLVILKDENGDYVTRGDRNIKINGENIKPILAKGVSSYPSIKVLNHVNITDYLIDDEGKKQIIGAVGFSINEEESYIIKAPQVICATGGAAGLYRPNNPGFSRHKMWYPPFNTGAGYAMGILSGAEMTTLEMRFIALRCKDTIAPTGTIAQGVKAKQTNSLGEIYESKYGLKTSERVYGTVMENREGRGPCFLDTRHITNKQEEELLKAYLNMAPSQSLKWIESGQLPSNYPVEIEGTEPYIVGGHTASGYWIDEGRRTTIHGLYAAGDVAGGAPQKYVTGALAEGEIAAESVLYDREKLSVKDDVDAEEIIHQYEEYLLEKDSPDIEQFEETMQKIMDEYAGGISQDYRYDTSSLNKAEIKIKELQNHLKGLYAKDMYELLHIYEIRERLIVCRALIAHLKARKETRWHAFAENVDYPDKDVRFEKYVNSRMEDDHINIIYRDLIRRGDQPLQFKERG
ncbi:MAG TPA: adenylyl-sulfate reductase subunit alpha [Kandleria vitulina]|nr:adenylyl-sulfate reductase subunit alpha [Kandleria vitulina]